MAMHEPLVVQCRVSDAIYQSSLLIGNGNKKLFDVVIKQELQERLVGLHKASTATPTKLVLKYLYIANMYMWNFSQKVLCIKGGLCVNSNFSPNITEITSVLRLNLLSQQCPL